MAEKKSTKAVEGSSIPLYQNLGGAAIGVAVLAYAAENNSGELGEVLGGVFNVVWGLLVSIGLLALIIAGFLRMLRGLAG